MDDLKFFKKMVFPILLFQKITKGSHFKQSYIKFIAS